MSWVGGAADWRSRREATSAATSDLEASDYESDQEMEIYGTDEQHVPHRRPPPSSMESTDDFAAIDTLTSGALYDAVTDIFSPANEVKRKTGDVLLNGRCGGRYRHYAGIDLDADLLEHAGHLPAEAGQMERVRFAQTIAQGSCRSRCGDTCTGDCRVRAFVDAGAHGVDFYFGTHEDIVSSVLTGGAECDAFIWDELEYRSMKKLYSHLDALLESCPGLAMRTTKLKTVDGLVLHHCDVAACFPELRLYVETGANDTTSGLSGNDEYQRTMGALY